MVDRLKVRLSVLGPPLLRLATLAIVGAVVGFFFGTVPALWVGIAGLVGLLAIHMSYASRLAAWLEAPNLDEIPNGWGLWTDVFARLYRQRRPGDRGTRLEELPPRQTARRDHGIPGHHRSSPVTEILS